MVSMVSYRREYHKKKCRYLCNIEAECITFTSKCYRQTMLILKDRQSDALHSLVNKSENFNIFKFMNYFIKFINCGSKNIKMIFSSLFHDSYSCHLVS